MPIYKEVDVHKIEIVPPHKIIQCRTETITLKDGKQIGTQIKRNSWNPLEDTNNAPKDVQDIAKLLWTDELKEAYVNQSPTS